jgi:hypothetical protein
MITADEFRRVVLSPPEAEERETWGHPTFRVRDKVFATLSDDGRQATVKATRQEQAALVAAAPETFDIPAYVGRHGRVGVRLATADPVELAELLIEGWRRTAPKRLAKAYDSTQPAHEPGSGTSRRVGHRERRVRVTGGRDSMRAWLLDPVRFR